MVRSALAVCILSGVSSDPAWWVGEPGELAPDWWKPVRQEGAASPLDPPCDQRDILVKDGKAFGATNNIMLTFVHMLALSVAHTPPLAVVVPDEWLKTFDAAFDWHAATRTWACVFARDPNPRRDHVKVTASEAFFMRSTQLADGHGGGPARRWSATPADGNFQRGVLRQLYWRPKPRLKELTMRFIAREVGSPRYDAVHLRAGHCGRWVHLQLQRVAAADMRGGTLTTDDVCQMTDAYIDASLALQRRVGPGSPHVVLAHDRANQTRADEIRRRYNASVFRGELAIHVDMQLMLRAERFVGSTASTVSFNVNSARDDLFASNLAPFYKCAVGDPCDVRFSINPENGRTFYRRRLTRAVYANGTDFRRQYFSRPVRRPGAVNEAVELLTQQEAARLAAAPARPRVYDDGPAIDGALPTCRVTHERMAAEGTFRRRASKEAPYNTTCFFFRPRYHDAPACGGPTEAWPDWGWDYTLESAVRGRCKMPDATPTRAARAFFEARPTGVKTEDRTLTVVMLGLSFMGQPYASLACLHQDLVVNGTSYHAKLTEDAPYGRMSLAAIRKDGGACLGVDRDKIRDAFPEATHPPSFPLPRQNAYRCSYDHSMIEFHEPGEPRVRVCYRYTFNMAKNLRPGSSLPCDLAWADIDIVLHAFPGEHFRELFLKRTGAPPHLSTILISVVNIWEGHLHAQLQDAYRREGLAAPERTDMQARPNACDRRDVHFRMPGFPDLEVQAWFSLIATGLRDVVYDSTKGGAVAGCWHQPPRQKSAPWRRCQDA